MIRWRLSIGSEKQRRGGLASGSFKITADHQPSNRQINGEAAGSDASAERPAPVAYLANCCVSTAGDEFQFLEIDSVRYSHILDPATGMGLTRQIQASVIAPHGINADGLDTTLCILGHEKAVQLMARHPDAAWILHELTPDGKVTSTPNKRFQELMEPLSLKP